MALTINSLIDETANVTFAVGKENVTVTYYPGQVMSSATQETIQGLKGGTIDGFDRLLCHIIKSWDVLDYDEITMFPLLPERVATLPIPFRMKVLSEILGDLNQSNPKPESVRSSAHYLN